MKQPLLNNPTVSSTQDTFRQLLRGRIRIFHRISYFSAFILLLLAALAGCKEKKKAGAKDLYGELEVAGKINTFPLYVVISENLPGNTFPEDIRAICGFSKGPCKTLPDAGILRAGADVYYKYNCFDELTIPESAEDDEAAITRSVQEQVNSYFAKTTLQQYDSLRTPNLPDWNVRDFPAMYVGNSSDSIFFYSNQPGAPATYSVGNRVFPVYTNVPELRARIDAIVCKGYVKVAVFYNAPSGDAATPATTGTPVSPAAPATSPFAARGSRAGDSCVETSRYEKLHDGSGGFMLGRLLKTNSTACGFVNTSPALTPPAEPEARPAAKTPAPSRLEPALGEEYDNPAPVRKDNQCFRRSEPVCEQDESKNYTGRRVQYCYNKAGQIVRTIVVSKCEADCRCF